MLEAITQVERETENNAHSNHGDSVSAALLYAGGSSCDVEEVLGWCWHSLKNLLCELLLGVELEGIV